MTSKLKQHVRTEDSIYSRKKVEKRTPYKKIYNSDNQVLTNVQGVLAKTHLNPPLKVKT